jgi:hypothetical protein
MQYPVTLVISNASVRSPSNPHPPEPTTEIYSGDQSAQYVLRYRADADAYYGKVLQSMTVPLLKNILKRRVDSDGRQISSTGSKKDVLVERIKMLDEEAVALRYRHLNTESRRNIERWIASDATANGNEVAATVEGVEVTRDMIADFRQGSVFRKTTMTAFAALFTERGKRLTHAHRRVNATRGQAAHYKERLDSLFVGPLVFDAGYSEAGQPDYNAVATTFTPDIFSRYHQIYMMTHAGDDRHALVVIDLTTSQIVHFDPRGAIPDAASKDKIVSGVMFWLRGAALRRTAADGNLPPPPDLTNPWPLVSYGQNFPADVKKFDPVTNAYDGGIFVIMAMEILCRDMPLMFRPEDATVLKENFLHWLLAGCLPIN